MDERTRLFERTRDAELRNILKRNQATVAQVKRTLQTATTQIEATLAAAPSDYQRWRLPQLRRSISNSLENLTLTLGETAADSTSAAWAAGLDLVDKPIEAGGIRLAAVLNQVDDRALLAIRTFMTDRLTNVTGGIARRIDSELAQVIGGIKAPSEAVSAVSELVEGGRGRAITIVRTEVGRAFSVAGQERMDQAREFLPGLAKQWRRSGKTHSRISHDLADGQIVATDEPFLVGGVALMYPRDPNGPIAETVNCGCTSLPHMADWDVVNPGVLPFTDDELARSENKRRVDQIRQSDG
jgi:hypothetical protein